MPKQCACGAALSAMNRRATCWKCREKAESEKKDQNRKTHEEEIRKSGLVLFHSCTSTIHDRALPCRCRKHVSFDEAKELIAGGLAVDFQTRAAHFFSRAILTSSKLKRPPVSTLGARIAIERGADAALDPDDLKRLSAVVAEDKAARRLEANCKIDVEHELALAEQARLIVFVDPEVLDEKEARSYGRPGIFVTSEGRTCIGRDVGSSTPVEELTNVNDAQDEDAGATEEEGIEGGDGEEVIESEAEEENEVDGAEQEQEAA